MNDNQLTDSLPKVRCSAQMRQALEDLAQKSMTPDLADHIREAIRMYLAMADKDAILHRAPYISADNGTSAVPLLGDHRVITDAKRIAKVN